MPSQLDGVMGGPGGGCCELAALLLPVEGCNEADMCTPGSSS